MKRAAAAIGLALALLAPATADAAGGTLRVRLNADILSTDPGVNRDFNTDAVVLHMVEGLVAFREDTSIGPLLAESYGVSEDGKTYSFVLREGVKFHNGAALTADDVVWSLKRYLDPATGWRCLSEFDGHGLVKILAVEAKDARNVVVTLDQPSALFLATLARADCGETAITHRDSVGPDGKWLAPIGTGPFKLVEWRHGQHVELARFDGYSARSGPRDGYTGGKHVEIDRLRFIVIPDGSAAKAAVLSNSIDIATSVSPVDVEDVKTRPEVRLDMTPVMGLTAVLLQTKDPLLSDVRIRRALVLSLDLPAITEAVMGGIAKPNNSAIPLGSPFYDAVQATPFKSDPAAAKKLLAEAGYKGQPIKLIANKRYAHAFDAAVLVQAMAQQTGIKLEIEVLDWAAQLDRYSKGDYQAMVFLYSARLDPSLSYEMLTGPKATQPRKVWDNPQIQTMLRESMQTLDAGKRQALFDTMHRQMLEDVPIIILFNDIEIVALRKNVAGFKGWLYGLPRFWDVSLN